MASSKFGLVAGEGGTVKFVVGDPLQSAQPESAVMNHLRQAWSSPPPSVDPCRSRRQHVPWPLEFDAKGWTLGILAHIELWSGYAVRDPCRRCGTSVAKFADQNGIEETEISFGSLGNKPRKGKYNLSISIQPSFSAADSELALARELTAKHGTIAILTQLAWASRMIIGPDTVPDIYVLDGVFGGKTLAWFVWPGRSDKIDRGSSRTWMRLTKGK